MPPPLRLTLIAAVTPSNGLGLAGGLPWSLPREMAHFRRATSHVPEAESEASGSTDAEQPRLNAVIMGRNTWESIPPRFRPLKGRINVVVSRTLTEQSARELGIDASSHAYHSPSLAHALDFLSSHASLARVFLIGGAQLYAQALEAVPAPHALDRLLITRLHTPAECDVFLSEYRTAQQVEADGGVQGAKDAQRPLKQEHWRKEEHAEMERWLGGEVGRGEQEEKATRYEFQMWTRR